MKSLKIAFFVKSFPSTSQTFIVNQIISLLKAGHDVTIFSLNRDVDAIIHPAIKEYNLLDKTVYRKEFSSGIFCRYLDFILFILQNINNLNFKALISIFNFKKLEKKSFDLTNYTTYKWVLKNKKFDIFHAHFGMVGEYVALMQSYGFCAKTKLVTSFHGFDISPHLIGSYNFDYKNLFNKVDLLTVNTIYTKKLLSQLTTKRIEILPVGLDTNLFKRKLEKNQGTVQLLFVGRLIELKAPENLIRIVEKLLIEGFNLQLNIIGDGELYSKLEKNIHQKSLGNSIHLKGALSQNEVLTYMENSDIFIMPGIHDKNGRAETQGLVIQEAQAMQLPVIVSNAGGMKYGVLNNSSGFVVEENDIQAFVNKIKLLINSPKLRKQMGASGRNFVVKNYDAQVLGNKLVTLYDRLLNE